MGGGDVLGRNAKGVADAQHEAGDREATDNDSADGHANEQHHSHELTHVGEQKPSDARPHIAAIGGGNIGLEHEGGLGIRTRHEDGEHRQRGQHHEGKAHRDPRDERGVRGQKHRDGKQNEREGHEHRALAKAEP